MVGEFLLMPSVLSVELPRFNVAAPHIRVPCGWAARGALTDAVQRHQGRFELAHSSTLFLDEIGDFPPRLRLRCSAYSRSASLNEWEVIEFFALTFAS
jgi:hypothetical protein